MGSNHNPKAVHGAIVEHEDLVEGVAVSHGRSALGQPANDSHTVHDDLLGGGGGVSYHPRGLRESAHDSLTVNEDLLGPGSRSESTAARPTGSRGWWLSPNDRGLAPEVSLTLAPNPNP